MLTVYITFRPTKSKWKIGGRNVKWKKKTLQISPSHTDLPTRFTPGPPRNRPRKNRGVRAADAFFQGDSGGARGQKRLSRSVWLGETCRVFFSVWHLGRGVESPIFPNPSIVIGNRGAYCLLQRVFPKMESLRRNVKRLRTDSGEYRMTLYGDLVRNGERARERLRSVAFPPRTPSNSFVLSWAKKGP